MRIAVPITSKTMEEALYDIETASKVADILELRIDYMKRPDLGRLLSSSPIPKIVTNRIKYEGGRFEGSEDQRYACLQEAVELGAEYVDIELNYFRQMPRKTTKLIVSYHNFDNTPENLGEIHRKLVGSGADIAKIATKANNYQDSLRMLNLISQVRAEGRDIIGLCMGKEGIVTRVLGPVYGGYLTFASLAEGKESAQGQITVDELRKTWGLLKFREPF